MIRFNSDILICSYFETSVSGGVLKLLPFGHSRHYPLEFNINDRKIILGTLNFFNTTLHKKFKPDNFIDTTKCEVFCKKSKQAVIVINLLDNCFGHSLLKLFDAIKFIDEKKNEFDFLLIIPKALKHFVIQEVGINVMYINASFTELENCYIINKEIEKVTEMYHDVFLEGSETYNSFDLELLKEKLNFFNSEKKSMDRNKIIFYYRSDYFRRWNGFKQGKSVENLFKILKPFFSENIKFVVTGDKDSYKFPKWIDDERSEGFSEEIDFKLNTLFNSAIICIGLTGSHMLFPSIFSACTVHLHPTFKYKNMAEDIVVNSSTHEMLSAYKHLYYFGNYNCSDIDPFKLSKLVLIHFQGFIEKQYKAGKFPEGQEEWINANYKAVNYLAISRFRAEQNLQENKKIRLHRIIDKVLLRK